MELLGLVLFDLIIGVIDILNGLLVSTLIEFTLAVIEAACWHSSRSQTIVNEAVIVTVASDGGRFYVIVVGFG